MDFITTRTALNVLLSADVVDFQTGVTTMSPVEALMLHVRMVSDCYWHLCKCKYICVHTIRARVILYLANLQ